MLVFRRWQWPTARAGHPRLEFGCRLSIRGRALLGLSGP
jgi:hypothetical protein